MRRIAIIAVLVAFPSLAAAEAVGHAPLYEGRPTGLGTFYDGTSSVIADYSAAMMRYRTAPGREGKRNFYYSLVRPGMPVGGPYTWVAEDGSIVRRVEKGKFVVTLADRPGNWFTEVACRMAEWPSLVCSDGRTREMSAPDLSTMVLDGVTYTRTLTEPELPSAEGEDAISSDSGGSPDAVGPKDASGRMVPPVEGEGETPPAANGRGSAPGKGAPN